MSTEQPGDDKAAQIEELKQLTLGIVALCVRNTLLENLHLGIVPDSKTGDYSDVKVVTPYGEIEWNKLSRLSEEEMKALMIEVTDKVFSLLLQINNPEVRRNLALYRQMYNQHWDSPKEVPVVEQLNDFAATLRSMQE